MGATFLFCLILYVMIVAVSGLGPCTVDVTPLACFDFDEFARYNDGVWPYRMVLDIEEYENITWAFQSFNPIASQGVYSVRIYRQLDCEGPSEWFHPILFDVDCEGVIVGKPEHSTASSTQTYGSDTHYNIVLDYEPGRYAYFYSCSETDTEYDYRFVVGECLCEEEKARILEIDQSYPFKGCLREL